MNDMYFFFFFFQAEDGIRDLTVTGVQTCALPISSYNVQICTDAANGIIVGVDVTQAGNDCDQLVNGVERVEANTGQTPEQVLVDGGYTMKNSNIEVMAERGIDLNGPVVENNSEASLKQRGIQPEFYPDKFRYDETTDTFTCPADKALKLSRTHPGEG